jgi:hypothetical protein
LISGLNRHVTTNRPSGGSVDPSEKWELSILESALHVQVGFMERLQFG